MNPICLSRIPLLAFTLAASATALAAPTADFFVSPNGNDGWSGTQATVSGKAGPFRTLDQARLAVRKLKASQPNRARPIVVLVRGGTYPLAQTLTFGPEDSGTARSPIVYAAYPGEKPILSGGQTITGWQVSGNRWQATVPGVKEGAWRFSQIYVGDQRRFRPQWPPSGYQFIEAAVGGTQPGSQDRFRYREGDVRADWANLGDVEALFFHSWGTSRIPIREVDPKLRVVTLGGGTWHSSLAELKSATWYRLENVKEALAQPGQWYLDRGTGILTYLPRPGETPTKTAVIAPRLSRIVELKGDVGSATYVDHLAFRGLTFAHSASNVGANGHSTYQAEVDLDGAIAAQNARHVAFEDCVVRHTGGHGIYLGAGSKDVRVQRCELLDLGGGGVMIGTGKFNEENDPKMWADGCAVRDSLVAHVGRVHPGSAGIWIGHAANNVVEHNDIHDGYYVGISVGWRWSTGPSPAHHNTIAYNHIYNMGQDVLSDLAGIYTLGESPGTTLRFNHIHDVRRSRYGGWGIYFDESSRYIIAEKNLVYRTEDAPFHLHHGRDNTVRNNVFAFGENAQIQLTNMEKSGPILLERNVFYWDKGKLFEGGPDDEIAFRRNLYWRAESPAQLVFAKDASLADWRAREEGVLVADPRFVNPSRGDFRLRAGSPTAKIGFEPFSVATAGRRSKVSKTASLPPVPRAFPAAPDEPPVVVREDFEMLGVGQGLPGWSQQAAGTHTNASVTEEVAASGRRSLKVTDSAEGATYFPHFFTNVRYASGTVRSAFKLRVEARANPVFEWRDVDPWYKAGPSVEVTPDGTLRASGKDLVKLPLGQWVDIEIVAGVGPQANGEYTVSVKQPGEGQPRRFEARYPSGFKTLGWIGFMSNAYSKAVYYVDDLVHEGVKR
jgi:hypothetical protein